MKILVSIGLVALDLLHLGSDLLDHLSNITIIFGGSRIGTISVEHVINLGLYGSELFAEGLELDAASLHVHGDHAVVHSLLHVSDLDALILGVLNHLLHAFGQLIVFGDLSAQSLDIERDALDVGLDLAVLVLGGVKLLLELLQCMLDVVQSVKIASDVLSLVPVVGALGFRFLLHFIQSTTQDGNFSGKFIDLLLNSLNVVLELLLEVIRELLQVSDLLRPTQHILELLDASVNSLFQVIVLVVEVGSLLNLFLEATEECLNLRRRVLARVILDLVESLAHIATLPLEIVHFGVELLQLFLERLVPVRRELAVNLFGGLSDQISQCVQLVVALLASVFQLIDQLVDVVDAVLTEQDLRRLVVIDHVVDLGAELLDLGVEGLKRGSDGLQLFEETLLLGEYLVDFRLLDLALSNLVERLHNEVEIVAGRNQLVLHVFGLVAKLVRSVELLLHLLHEGLLLLVANGRVGAGVCERTHSFQLVDHVEDFLHAVVRLLGVIINELLAFVEQFVALIDGLVLLDVLGAQLADERLSEAVDPLLNLLSVNLRGENLLLDLCRLPLDAFVALDELGDLTLRLGHLVGLAHRFIVLIEQLHVLVDVLDDELFAHLKRGRIASVLSRHKRLREFAALLMGEIDTAFGHFVVGVDLVVTLLELLDEFAHDLILTLQIFVSEALAQPIDLARSTRNLIIQLIDDFLQVLERLLDLRNLLLALLVVLVHLILERLQTEALQLIEVLAQAWQVNLVLSLQALGNTLQRLDIFRLHVIVGTSFDIFLNILSVRNIVISNTAHNLSGASVAIDLLLDEDEVTVRNAIRSGRVIDLALEVFETVFDFIELLVHLLVKFTNFAQ